jgi:hypothetical protein
MKLQIGEYHFKSHVFYLEMVSRDVVLGVVGTGADPGFNVC